MGKYDLKFEPPHMNAAGFSGFAFIREQESVVPDFSYFITNPVSLRPRQPVNGNRIKDFPGGLLMHTGFPNAGISSVLRKFSPSWEKSRIPVIVHLFANEPDELAFMMEKLEEVKGVVGVEIGVPDWVDKHLADELQSAIAGELPVIFRIPINRIFEFAGWLDDSGSAAALSFGPPRGRLVVADGQILEGRIYGPSLYPQVLYAVKELSSMKTPVLAGGGVYRKIQLEELLDSGAAAVQLDTVLWRGGFLE